jgi:hypothetical protein
MSDKTIRKKLALQRAYELYSKNKPFSKDVFLELLLCDIDPRPLLRGKFDDLQFISKFIKK